MGVREAISTAVRVAIDQIEAIPERAGSGLIPAVFGGMPAPWSPRSF
jgi:hypothetical protein